MRDRVNGGLMKPFGAPIHNPASASGVIQKMLVDQYGRVISSTPAAAADLATLNLVAFPAGVAAGTGVTASEKGGLVHRTRLTLAAAPIVVTDALAYGGQKVYDFPEGRILVLGATCSLAFAVTTARASTINDSAALKFALGSATASNATLATTMVDLIPKTSKTLDGAVAAYTTAVGAALAASAQFDGTGTPLDAYLNLAFETNTDIDGDGTIAINGTIDLTWINLGDY